MARPRLRKAKLRNDEPASPITQNSYNFVPTTLSHPKCKQNIPTSLLIFAANGKTYSQARHLLILWGQFGFQDHPSDISVDAAPPPQRVARSEDSPNVCENVPLPDTVLPVGNSIHKRKWITQTHCWMTDTIPHLVKPYMRLLRKTKNLSVEPEVQETTCTCLTQGRHLEVKVMWFQSTCLILLVSFLYKCDSRSRNNCAWSMFMSTSTNTAYGAGLVRLCTSVPNFGHRHLTSWFCNLPLLTDLAQPHGLVQSNYGVFGSSRISYGGRGEYFHPLDGIPGLTVL